MSCSMKQLELSSNLFDDKSFDELRLALNKNQSLRSFDIRICKFKPGEI